MKIQYETEHRLPTDVDVAAVTTSKQVVVLLNPRSQVEDIADSLTLLAAASEDHGRQWEPLGEVG